MRPMKLVYIEWFDSYTASPTWKHLEEYAETRLVCRSVGWLLSEEGGVMVIVPHLAGTDGAVDPIAPH